MKRQSVRQSLIGLTLLFSMVLTGCPTTTTPMEMETPTIAISITPTSASVAQGASTDVDVTVTGGGGFTGAATVTAQNLPSGVTGSVGNVQNSGGNTTATVTISVGAAVPGGNYTLTIGATGSGVSAVTTSFALTVSEPPAYDLSATPGQLIVEQAAQGTIAIAISRTNFTGDVTLAVEGAPSEMTTSFDVNPVSGNAAVLTIGADAALATGTYPLTIRGTAAGLTDRTSTVSVVVTMPGAPDYLIDVTPAALSVQQGSSEDASITLTRSNFADPVTLSAEGVPANVTVSFSENPVADNDSEMTVAVDAAVPTGAYSFTLRGAATGLADKTVTIDLTVEGASSYTLSLNPPSIALEQGESGTVDVMLARSNFTDAVTLSLEGAPAGVTGLFSVNPTTGDASVLTLDVGPAVAATSYILTVRGTTASLSDVTETLTLSVTEVVGFSLDAIAPITIQQNASGIRTVAIARTGGFAGDVTVTVTDLPAGITASVDPVTTAGASTDVTFSVSPSVAVGNYTATVRGNATGQPESAQTIDISVITASGQQVSLDFSVCVAAERPVWLAYQDGAGPWTPVSGVGDTYTFNVASSQAAVAVTTLPAPGSSSVIVFYGTQAELVSGNVDDICDEVESGKTVNATVAGINPVNLEGATISLAEASVDAFSDGPISIDFVPNGNLDLVGYKWSLGSATSRMIIERDLNPADNSNLGTLDFAGASAFDPAAATITVQGGSGTGAAWFTEYATSPSPGACYYASLDDDIFVGTSFTVGGAPVGQQQPGDFHYVAIVDGGLALVSETFATLANRTIAFGAVLPTPTVTDLTGAAAYRRARAQLTLPAEYNSTVSFALVDGSGNASISALATGAWLGGQSVSLEVPDFTGLAGWVDAWAPTSASTTDWALSAYGWSGDDCTEGAREVSRTTLGTVG